MSLPERYDSFAAELARYAPGLHNMGAPAGVDAIGRVAQSLGRSLPAEYREFLLRFNGGTIFNEAVHFFPASSPHPKEADLITANTQRRVYWPSIPVQDLIVAEYSWPATICFAGQLPSSIETRVYRWDHELGKVIGEWNAFDGYLASETERLKSLYSYDGRLISAPRRLLRSLVELFRGSRPSR